MNFKRLSSLVFLSSGAFGVLMAQSSCSVIVNDFPAQCETDQDCLDIAAKVPLGDDGKPVVDTAGLVCNQERKVCEKTGCDTNVQCRDALGQDAICRHSDRTCQKLVLPGAEPDSDVVCDILVDSKLDDEEYNNVLWLGASVIYAPGTWQGLELVRRDFALGSGLPPASAGGQRRPLGFVYCEADPTLEEGMEHLVNTLELPVVITSVDTTSEITLLENYSKPNDVFQLSTTAGGPQFKNVPNDGLIVDLVLINEHYDIEAAQLVDTYYTPLLREDGGPLAADELPRIAVVHSSTPTYENLSRKMQAELEKVTSEDHVRLIGYGSEDEPSGNPAAYAGVVSDVLEFKPHVIIIMGDDEIGPAVDDAGEVTSAGIDVPIEERWAAEVPDQPPPQWLGILGTVGQLPKDMATLEPGPRFDWASRSLFIQQHYDFEGDLFTEYFRQLEMLVGPDDPAGVLDVEKTSPYNEFMREGAYLTAYAVALLAAQGKEVTGPNVAAAAKSFGKDSSASFTVGPDDIFNALESIASSKKPFFLENFQGWVGFDDNGFAQYEFADDVACLTAKDGELDALQPTGGIFDTSGGLTGTVSLNGCAAPSVD